MGLGPRSSAMSSEESFRAEQQLLHTIVNIRISRARLRLHSNSVSHRPSICDVPMTSPLPSVHLHSISDVIMTDALPFQQNTCVAHLQAPSWRNKTQCKVLKSRAGSIRFRGYNQQAKIRKRRRHTTYLMQQWAKLHAKFQLSKAED